MSQQPGVQDLRGRGWKLRVIPCLGSRSLEESGRNVFGAWFSISDG